MSASKAKRAETAQRRAQAVRLRIEGKTYEEIAEIIGYPSRSSAYIDITRALEANVAEQARSVEVYREEEIQRLDMLLSTAWDILKHEHATVSHGRVVYDDSTGAAIPDVGPVLQAMDRILKIQERRAKLLGLDAPTRHELVTLDAIDAEIKRLSAELGSVEAAEIAATAGTED